MAKIKSLINDISSVLPFLTELFVGVLIIDFLVFTFPEITAWFNHNFHGDYKPMVITLLFQLIFIQYKVFKFLSKCWSKQCFVPKV